MNLPDNFIKNTFILFIRFCKENNLYKLLDERIKCCSIAETVDSLLSHEQRFFNGFNSYHCVDVLKNVHVPIYDFSDAETTYFSMVRLLNIIFVGGLGIDRKEYQDIHKKLFEFLCVIKPTLIKYYKKNE